MRKFVNQSPGLGQPAKDMNDHGRTGFVREDDGTMSILTIFLIVLMLMVGGIGVDLMRFERDRARLQSALDRAVLAAADLDQKQDPKVVVLDYLAKEGLQDYIKPEYIKVTPENSGEVNTGPLGFRIVEAYAKSSFPTMFMSFSGVEELTASASSVAEERIGDVEISLVLDVSGSMNDYNRLVDLKVAAKKFVNQMTSNTRDGDLSISIIPYATQVSLPDYMMPYMSVSGENQYANCVNFESSDFTTTELDLSVTRERTLHMNPWPWTGWRWDFDLRPQNRRAFNEICDDGEYYNGDFSSTNGTNNREVLPFQKDPAVINRYIDNLEAWGNTSIDAGVKWGLALLDDSVGTMISGLAGSGQVPSTFENRPASHDITSETMKVMVLMTDGKNTTQYQIKSPYRKGESMMWWNAKDKVYSSYSSSYDRYYWHGFNRWEDHPYGTGNKCVSWDYYGYCKKRESGGANRLNYPELWEQTSVKFVRDLMSQRMGSYDADRWYNQVVKKTGQSTKDSRVKAMCKLAKNRGDGSRGTIIYGIAFEAPAEGIAVLNYNEETKEGCSSSKNHFYRVGDPNNPMTIDEAFSSIGSSIRKLRLTQ